MEKRNRNKRTSKNEYKPKFKIIKSISKAKKFNDKCVAYLLDKKLYERKIGSEIIKKKQRNLKDFCKLDANVTFR